MRYRVRKLFTFEAAHQLDAAVTADCHRCIHGHTYTVEIVLGAFRLNGMAMVLDFGVLKEIVDRVKGQYDHALILTEARKEAYGTVLTDQCLKVLTFEENPTAEAMAHDIYLQVVEFLTRYLRTNPQANAPEVERVRVHETATGYAEYSVE